MFHRYAELKMQNYRTAQVSIWHVSVVSLKSLDVVLQLNTFKNSMTFDGLRDPRVFVNEHELNAF